MVFLIPFACTEFLFPQTTSAQRAVYPLHVGDRWEYWTAGVGGSYDFTSQIIADTTFPNGHTYAHMVGLFFPPYQRQVGDSVFQYFPTTGTEQLLFDFSANPGDTITQYPNENDSAAIVFLRNQSTSIFGRTLRQWVFLIDHLKHAVDDEERLYVTDSLGVTYVSCFCPEWTLHGADIDGIEYGSINAADNGYDLATPLLENSYPNPFNASTTIRFTLPRSEFTSVKLFDLLGQEVATLLEQRLQPGVHTAVWDATGFPSGIYSYRLRAGSFSATGRVLLVK